jgi:hypothetical protein
VFRFPTCVPIGGALYPWRCRKRVVGARPFRVRISRTPQQETLSPAMSDRSICLLRHHDRKTSRIFRGFSHALRCLTMGTVVARPGNDGSRPVQLRPICLWHQTGDTRSSFSVPFLALLPRRDGIAAVGRKSAKLESFDLRHTTLLRPHGAPTSSEIRSVKRCALDTAVPPHRTNFASWP